MRAGIRLGGLAFSAGLCAGPVRELVLALLLLLVRR